MSNHVFQAKILSNTNMKAYELTFSKKIYVFSRNVYQTHRNKIIIGPRIRHPSITRMFSMIESVRSQLEVSIELYGDGGSRTS